MPTRAAQCTHREAVQALAEGLLTGAPRQTAERHLERCEACRGLFRQRTADRFPRFRSYTILEEIGKGGFGVVYKAIHHSKARIEALKVLFGKSPLREAYFENEVHLAAKLRHPNIATLHEAHLQTAPHYYAMEYVPGPNLDEYLHDNDVSLEARIELIKAVAHAVDYAHREGVIHRDLKPQNILIDPQGQPRILDFGIARRLALGDEESGSSGLPRSEGAMGTYGYMSPEQLAGQRVDERADIYSLGALLFRVVTGQPARYAPQIKRLARTLRRRQVSRAADLAAIIAHCVDPVPEQRYAGCAALIKDLDHYLTGRMVHAPQELTPAGRATRMAGLMLRNYAGTIQVMALVMLTAVLARVFWEAEARWAPAVSPSGGVALIMVGPQTERDIRTGRYRDRLPELSALDRKSRRLLYGQLMEHLGQAGVRAIVWDYYFPDEQPEFDPAFAAGAAAASVPIIVGAAVLDVNAEPVLAPTIRAAVDGWGTLFSKDTAFLKEGIFVPLALKRGFNPPVPSLAVAAFAAARHPDCEPDLRAEGEQLVIRYRKRDVEPGKSRWLRDADRLSIFETEVVGDDHRLLGFASAFKPGDQLYLGRYPLDAVVEQAGAAIPASKILDMAPDALRQRFAGRVVLIGEQSPRDRQVLQDGRIIHGCQIHAHMLDSLLAGATIGRYPRLGLVARVFAWCALAALLANLLPTPRTWSMRAAALASAAVLLGTVVVAAELSALVASVWALETLIAISSLAAAWAVIRLVRLGHLRQLRLTPGPAWTFDEALASTAVNTPAEPASSANN